MVQAKPYTELTRRHGLEVSQCWNTLQKRNLRKIRLRAWKRTRRWNRLLYDHRTRQKTRSRSQSMLERPAEKESKKDTPARLEKDP